MLRNRNKRLEMVTISTEVQAMIADFKHRRKALEELDVLVKKSYGGVPWTKYRTGILKSCRRSLCRETSIKYTNYGKRENYGRCGGKRVRDDAVHLPLSCGDIRKG